MVSISSDESAFEKCFAAYSVVLVGTRNEDGDDNLAPKHMATPLGWSNYFGFVCTESHQTFANIEQTEQFTISYPRPNQILSVSLAAEPRDEDGEKPDLGELPTAEADAVNAPLVSEAYLQLECQLHSISEPFGDNQMIAGDIVEQRIHRDALRGPDRDDNELINENPVLAYLHPGRYAEVHDSQAFPFPGGFHR
jgi:flavin reductase (DIM6/NTAB) family NADH-FMN oxidoreductase RutF